MVSTVSSSSTTVQGGYAANSATTTSTVTGNGMNGDDFMQLLLAQLKHQNPLDPMDEQAMMNQFTQLNSLQELQKITAAIESSTKSTRLTDAAVLIGKNITFKNDSGESETGIVTGVSLVGDKTMLYVGDKMVPQSSVTAVSAVTEDEGE